MPKRNSTQEQQPVAPQIVLPESLQAELTLLRGFAVLVSERTAYMFGSKSLSTENSDKTKEERKASSEANKAIRDNLADWVKEGNADVYKTALETVEKARKAYNTAAKPIRDKIAPLRRGMKYIDVVAIPDSIKELHTTVTDEETRMKLVVKPAFTLSEWVGTAIEAAKKRQ